MVYILNVYTSKNGRVYIGKPKSYSLKGTRARSLNWIKKGYKTEIVVSEKDKSYVLDSNFV